VLVRHGQSIPYVDGEPFQLVDGHGDPPLSPRGLWQADRVRERMANYAIDAINVSSLTRTHQTAAPLADLLGLVPQIEPDLREVYLGDFEGGLLRKLLAEGHPAVEEMRRSGEWGALPGAETSEQLRLRTAAVIDRLVKAHADELIVVVCHGGVIAALLGHAMDRPWWMYSGVRNASMSHMVITDERWIVRSFNDAGHVGSLTGDSDPTQD
jgi:probable phosphoglycerate mutase